jgi:hypothetical protein
LRDDELDHRPLDEEDEDPLPFPELLELELELLPFFFFLPGAASVKLWLATMMTRATNCDTTPSYKRNRINSIKIYNNNGFPIW